MKTEGFRARLERRQREHNTLVGLGLDPNFELFPEPLLNDRKVLKDSAILVDWAINLVDEDEGAVSLVKPQHAYWGAVREGPDSLERIIKYIHQRYPELPVLTDSIMSLQMA